MSQQSIAYSSIDLVAPTRVFRGRHKSTDVSAVAGVTITRVIDGTLDLFLIAGPSVYPGLEIEARNVAAGVRAESKWSLRGKGGKASDDVR